MAYKDPARHLEYNKLYDKNHRKERSAYKLKWARLNREKVKQAKTRYYLKNRIKCIQYSNDYQKKKLQVDPVYKCRHSIRNLIGLSIRVMGYSKKSKTEQILGCSFDKFKQYIEKQFEPWMNWLNHGEWHIDHIIPLATAKTEAEVLKLNHHTNLKPLKAFDNLSKGAKYG